MMVTVMTDTAMTDSDPAVRPAYATRACYLAIALTIGYVALSLVGWFTGPVATAPAVVAVKVVSACILVATLIAGLAAATRTLNGSNGWRVALIVFGWLTVVQSLGLIVLGALAGTKIHTVDAAGNDVDSRIATHSWWVVWGAVWVVGAALCSIWLARRDVVAWTKPPSAPALAPAGWYPWHDGRPHYWTGTQWAEQIPPPTGGD